MAANSAGAAFSVSAGSRGPTKGFDGIASLNSIIFSSQRKFFPSIRLQPAPKSFRIAAKPETVKRVCEIVKQQLLISEKMDIAEASFSRLGADSLDRIEILLNIEDAFEISIKEDLVPAIATVEDAANMIDELRFWMTGINKEHLASRISRSRAVLEYAAFED